MSANSSGSWTPTYGSATFSTFAPTDVQTSLSPSRYSYTTHSVHEESEPIIRRYNDDSYTDDDSLSEVERTLTHLDDEITHTENTLSQWSRGSYTDSYTESGTFTDTYTGSPSHVTLPATRSPDPRIRLSRITEHTEESRPTSGTFLASPRPIYSTPDDLHRSTFFPGDTQSGNPSGDRTLPPPGRTAGLIAQFESQSGSYSRFPSTPGHSGGSLPTTTLATTGYNYGSTSYGSRPSSPSKFSGSFTNTEMRSTYPSLLTPSSRTMTSDYMRAIPSDTLTRTLTNTQTGTDTVPGVNSSTLTTPSYTDTGSTFAPTSSTTLRRPQTIPRSPLASVRNLVSAWKEKAPASRSGEDKLSDTNSNSLYMDREGLNGIRRRVQRAGARLRESGGLRPPGGTITPEHDNNGNIFGNGDSVSHTSGRNEALPLDFDLRQFSPYTQSNEAPLYIGLLWYLNVHAAPPYRWQRCQALLYLRMLLLSWIAPGGGRGIVALDLLNCTAVQSAPSPTHPSARDDVGTVAARIQSAERDGQPLMDILVPFHMMYADGVERLAAESLRERQKWVNRVQEAVSRPASLSDPQLTRSPTASIRTIDSHASSTSVGSRSTVFVPPLSSLPDIVDYRSESSSLIRRLSFVSSHHSGTVDDTVIQNDGYVYPGDRRVIAPSRGNSLRRSGSMTDIDTEFKASSRARGKRPRSGNMRKIFEYSPASMSSASAEGKNAYITPPTTTASRSRPYSQMTDGAFFSPTSSRMRSNVSSTYFSGTEWTGAGTSMGAGTGTGTVTQIGYNNPSGLRSDSFTPSTAQPGPSLLSHDGIGSQTLYSNSSQNDSITLSGTSASTLFRTRAVTRRVRGNSRSGTSAYTVESSDKENVQLAPSDTPSDSVTQAYTLGSSALTPDIGSYTITSGDYTPESEIYSGTYTSGSNSHTGTYTPTTQSGSYTSGSHTESFTVSGSGNSPGSGIESYTDSVTTGGSGTYTMSGSGSYNSSYTPSGASENISGSHTPGSLSYGSVSYDPGSASYTGTHTSITASQSISNSFTRGTETGYDICPSSDLTTLTQTSSFTYGETLTPPARHVTSPHSRIQDTLAVPERRRTTSQASSEYLTAEEMISGPSSPASFKSLSTIPSLPDAEFITADGGSTTYKTASESSAPSEYHTAFQMYTQSRSPSDSGLPQEIEAVEEKQPAPIIAPELERETEPPRERDLRPQLEEFELEYEKYESVIPPISEHEVQRSGASTPKPLSSVGIFESEGSIFHPIPVAAALPRPSPSEIPTIPSPRPTFSDVSSEEIPLPFTESLPSMPSPPTTTESVHVPTPSTMHQSLLVSSRFGSDSEFELLPPLPETDSLLESGSVPAPSNFEGSSAAYIRSRSLPPTPRVASEPTLSTPSLPSVPSLPSLLSSSSDAPTPSSLPISTVSLRSGSSIQGTSWARETNLSYESSILNPSPSLRSLVVHDLPEASYDTSLLRPSASSVSSLSSDDKLSTVPPSTSPLTSLASRSPLASITPLSSLPASASSVTPLSLSISSGSVSSTRSPVRPPADPIAPVTARSVSSSYMTESEVETSVLEYSSSLADTIEVGLEGPEPEVELPLVPRDEGDEDQVSTISTEPSLLSTAVSSEHIRSRSATPVASIFPRELSYAPSPVRAPSVLDVQRLSTLTTPEDSGSVSEHTPTATAVSAPGTLLTESSQSVEPPRDIGRDLDRLADDLRRYHDTRGEEAQGLADNLRVLRGELRDLSDFLHRPSSPIIVQQSIPEPSRIIGRHIRGPRVPQRPMVFENIHDEVPVLVTPSPPQDIAHGPQALERPIIFERIHDDVLAPTLTPLPAPPHVVVSRAIGSDGGMTEEIITMEGYIRDSGVTVTRSNSNASSMSFLSSHHSDDSLLEGSVYESSDIDWEPVEPVESMSMVPEDRPRTVPMFPDDSESFEDETEISTSSFASSLETTSLETSASTPTPETTTSLTPTPERSTTTPGPVTPVTPVILMHPPSIATTSSLSTPVATRAAPLPTPPLPAAPSLDDLMDALRGQLDGILHQLTDLQNGQGSTNRMLDLLRSRPESQPVDNSELHDRLHRIEDLMRGLTDQSRRQEPIVVPIPEPAPPPESEHPESSILTTSDSLSDLRIQLEGFPSSRPPLRMPVPSQAMPSILDQLMGSISSLPPAVANRPPPLQPFVFEPRSIRPRSASPVSMDTLPPRPFTVSIPDITFYDPRGVGPSATHRTHTRPRGEATARSPEMTASDYLQSLPSGRIPPFAIPQEHLREVDQIYRHQRPRAILPTPQPVFSQSLPRDSGAATVPPSSWYLPSRPSQRPPPLQRPPHPVSSERREGSIEPTPTPLSTTQPGPTSAPGPAPGERVYIPMPSGPIQIPMPPEFDAMMEVLRENRLAQVATVDQQRELMRYMADLNNWLARDVQDRQAEIRGVNARIENLRREVNNLAAGRGTVPRDYSPTVTSSSEEQVTMPSQAVPMPMPQHYPPGTFIPGPYHQPGTGVHPPVIPPDITPSPSFPPVIPPVIPGTHPGVVPADAHTPGPWGQQAPVIPIDHTHTTPGPGPSSHHFTPMRRSTTPDQLFIPPDVDALESEGEPRRIPPPTGSRMNLVVPGRSPSPSSSRTESTQESHLSRRSAPYPSRQSSLQSSRSYLRDRSGSISNSSSGSSGSRSPSRTPRGSVSGYRSGRSQTETPGTRLSASDGALELRDLQPAVVHGPPRSVPEIEVIPVPPQHVPTVANVPRSPQYPDQQQQQPPPQAIIIGQPGMQQPMGSGMVPPTPTTHHAPSAPTESLYMPPSHLPPPIIIQTSPSRSRSDRSYQSSRTGSPSSRRHRSRSQSESPLSRHSSRRDPQEERDESPTRMPPSRSPRSSRSRYSHSPSRHYYTPTTPVPPQPVTIHPSESRPRSSRSFSPSRYEPGVPSEHEVSSEHEMLSHPLPSTIIQMPPQSQPPVPLLRSPSSRSLSIERPRTESRSSGRSPSRRSIHSRPRSPTPIPIMIPSTAPTPLADALPTVLPPSTSAQQPQIVVPLTSFDHVPPQLQPPTPSRSDPLSRSWTPSHLSSQTPSKPPSRTPITIAPSRGRSRSRSGSRRRLGSHSPSVRPTISGGYPPRHTRSRSYSPTGFASTRVPRYPSSRRGHSPHHDHSPRRSPSILFYPSSHRRSPSETPVRGRDRSLSRTPTGHRRRSYSRSPPQEHRDDRRPHRRPRTPSRDHDGVHRQRSYTLPRERGDDHRRRSRTPLQEHDGHRRRRSRTPLQEHDGHRRRRSRTPLQEHDGHRRRRSRTPSQEHDDHRRRRSRTPSQEHDDHRRGHSRTPPQGHDDDHHRRSRVLPRGRDDDQYSYIPPQEHDDDHQQYSRVSIDDHDGRRSSEYRRNGYPSVSRYSSSRSHAPSPSLGPPDSPSGVHPQRQLSPSPSRHGLPCTPVGSLTHALSESPLPVLAPETHHVGHDHLESRPSRPKSPITVSPSPTASRASHVSRHAPTVVAIEPEDIDTHDLHQIPRSRTPTARHPSVLGYYSPVHSLYEADSGHPHSPTGQALSQPAIPTASTSSRTPTVPAHAPPHHIYSSTEPPASGVHSSPTRSPGISISAPPATRSPPVQPLRREDSGSPVHVSRQPSERRTTLEGRPIPIDYVLHEVPVGVHPVTESDAGCSDYDSPLPVPPHGLASTIHPPPRSHRSATPIELQDAEHERERHERLGAIERHLHDVALAAAQAEDEREAEFRRNEEHRERIFLDNQERREHENRERTEHLWDTLQSRLETLPPARPLHELSDRLPPTRPPSIRPRTPRTSGTSVSEVVPEVPPEPSPEAFRLSAEAETQSIASSMRSVVEGVASRHAEDILETVRLEREEFARERESAATERGRLMNEAEENRRQFQEEQAAHIRALEDALAAVKADLQSEKQARMAEEADVRERERAEFLERDELLRAQLNDITNLLQDNRDITVQKKLDSDDRYAEKAARRQNKESQVIELHDMVQKIYDDLQAEIQRATDERIQNQSKPTLESIVEQLQRQNAEQQELLRQLSEDWRNDCERHHKETLEAVKSTAQEQVPFNVQGYLDEFSKALAAEVRMLLGEVGKLREERRNLQHEMGFLLCMKSKYGPGGEFQPDWQPPAATVPAPQEPPPADTGPPPDLSVPAAKPGWRQIGKRKAKKKDRVTTHAPPPAVPPPSHVHPHHMMDARRQVAQSWATWLPDPDQVPTPPSVEPSLTVPRAASPGLFGPRTPSNRSWAE